LDQPPGLVRLGPQLAFGFGRLVRAERQGGEGVEQHRTKKSHRRHSTFSNLLLNLDKDTTHSGSGRHRTREIAVIHSPPPHRRRGSLSQRFSRFWPASFCRSWRCSPLWLAMESTPIP